jgi:hypothetical protein
MGVRRQIYLDERDNRLLEEQHERTGLSVSELVRQAIHKCYGVGRRLTWDEVNARTVEANSAGEDGWVYDPLFDDEWIDDQMHRAGANGARSRVQGVPAMR